jgi:hypothetical protein
MEELENSLGHLCIVIPAGAGKGRSSRTGETLR